MAHMARLIFLILAYVTLAAPQGMAAAPNMAWPSRSWEDMRWDGVVRQQSTSDCGPAAVTTLLQLLGTPVPPYTAPVGDQATTMAQLRAMLARYGWQSQGMLMEMPGLLRYLADTDLPLIAHVLMPTPHFTVVGAALPNRIVVHDPTLGTVSWEYSEWQALWTGLVLVLWPPPPAEVYAANTSTSARLELLSLLHTIYPEVTRP